MDAIKPHGGKLVNRITQKNTNGMFSVSVSEDLANDVENIADGIFSPLEGFLSKPDFDSVITKGRLSNDLAWTVPIVLDVDKDSAQKAKDFKDIALQTTHGVFAILHVEDSYTFDKTKTSQAVYGTTDINHPGVAKTMSMNDYLLGGKIDYIKRPDADPIRKYRLTPNDTRKAFSDAGWKTIAAFQTRNPPHVAHEMLQKNHFSAVMEYLLTHLLARKNPVILLTKLY